MRQRTGRWLAGLAIGIIILALYSLWARPNQLRWGATAQETERAMAGDELDRAPAFLATRAITIDASPQEIWPWLMQMGYTRAGFYGFDLFEKMGTVRGPLGVDRILPQYQDFQVGDEVPISPVDSMVFQAIQPHAYIVWASHDKSASYTWALYPIDDLHTRLVTRTRWNHHWGQPGRLVLDLLTEFTDHVAMRKVLEGIKGRVEGQIRPRSDLNVEVFLYIGALAVFLWALVAVLRLPLTWISWLLALLGGLAWLLAWYGPDSIWIGLSLSLLVVWGVRLAYREHKRRRMMEKSEFGAQGHASARKR